MPRLPNQYNIVAAASSEFDIGYALQDDSGAIMNISAKTFEFVIRPAVTDATVPALIAVNSSAATAQGYITVNVAAGTLLVVLSPTATALLGQGARPYTLWMDPGLTDATALVIGTFNSTLIAAA